MKSKQQHEPKLMCCIPVLRAEHTYGNLKQKTSECGTYSPANSTSPSLQSKVPLSVLLGHTDRLAWPEDSVMLR